MANFQVSENPEYTEEIRKFETEDEAHADLFNNFGEKLVNNGAFLKNKLVQHTENNNIHITAEEREDWSEDTGEKEITFSQATSRENLISGEKLKTSLGKIKKWFTDLKTVAFTGSYNDLSNTPAIPSTVRVKGNAESAYRVGNVNLTPENIGALPLSGGTLTGDLRIKGSGNYGTKINLGDGDYVHFSEPTDDCLEVKAKRINFLVSDSTDAKFTLNGEKIGAKADKLTTARSIDGISFDGSANISRYAVCSTAGSVAEKVVSIPNFSLTNGARITIDFLYENTAKNPTLKVNNTEAKEIVYRHSGNSYEHICDIGSGIYDFVYNGVHWEMVQGAVATNSMEGNNVNTISEVYSGFKYVGGAIKNYPFLKLSFLSITFQATVETSTGNNISVCRMQKSPSVNTALSARVSRNIGAINAVIFTGGNLSIATDRAIPAEGYILCSGIYPFA